MRQLNTQSNVIETIGHIDPAFDRITNGDMLGTLFPWQQDYTVGGKYSVSQNAGSVTPPLGYTNYLGVTSLSSYSVGSSDSFGISQSITGEKLIDLGWGTTSAKSVTLSFWVYSSLTGTFGGAIQNAGLNRSYPFTFSINTASTWEKKSITIPGDQSGSWTMTGSNVGLWVRLGLGAGATLSGTAGTWAGADYRTATGAVSIVGTNGATFYMAGISFSLELFLILNVRDFGAKGDAVTDDAAAFQSALNRINTRGGGTLYVPTGIYMIGSKLTIYSYTHIVGASRYGTKLRCTSTLADRMIVNAARDIGSGYDRDITIKSLTIDQNVNTHDVTPTFSRIQFFVIDDVIFSNCDGTLLLLTGNPDVTLNQHCIFNNIEWAGGTQTQNVDIIDIGSATDVKITNCYFHGGKSASGNPILSAAIMDNFQIRDCIFDGESNAKPANFFGITNGLISGCEFKNSPDVGFKIEHWTEVAPEKEMNGFVIENSTIYNNGNDGVHIHEVIDTTRVPKNIHFRNNRFFGNGKSAIHSNISNGLTIIGNAIYNNSTLGVGSYYAIDLSGGFSGGYNLYVNIEKNNFFDTNGTPKQTKILNCNYVQGVKMTNNFVSNYSTMLSTTANSLDMDVRGNWGYNPVGISAITVTASPFTYQAGFTPETVYIVGGTVSNVTRSGSSLVSSSHDYQIQLEPKQSVVVTYSVAPTMYRDIK